MREHVTFGVVGLDLSLKRAAACYVPPDWDPCDWKRLRFRIVGGQVVAREPEAVARRLSDIAHGMVDFVDQAGKGAKVFSEDYGFGAQHAAAWIGEGGGVVKKDLWERLGVVVVPVNQSTVRKTFLGKLPRKGAGTVVVQVLRRLGFPWEGSDEADALIVALHGRSLLGMPALTVGER